MKLTASIVLYKTDGDELRRCVTCLRDGGVERIMAIDNSPDTSLRALCEELGIEYVSPGRNLGYGAAHNIALRHAIDADTTYHLVINTDVWFAPDTLPTIVAHMDGHPDIVQLIPSTVFPDGRRQDVVRLLPTPFDLIVRRFLPSWAFSRSRERYLLHMWDQSTELNVAYHQGSFMFLRVSALREVGLFDERFFMYPEDIDLTRRMHRVGRTVFYPGATIVHAHRAASHRPGRMMWIHLTNMARYFNKWGWLRDGERRTINRRIISELNNSAP